MKSTEEDQNDQVFHNNGKDPSTPNVHLETEDCFQSNYLEKCGKWLQSLPRDDMIALRETSEYSDFLRAFEKLGQAHHQVVTSNRMDVDSSIDSGEQESSDSLIGSDRRKGLMSSFSFLQRMVVDDVALRVMEFLDCLSLIQTSATCSRFRELANESAKQRTHAFASSRKLNQVMQLLRAKEQIEGVGNPSPAVRVPMLGLAKRVLVTNAGDPEYNGIYHCTHNNGNGFVFTKARNSFSRVPLDGSRVYSRAPIANPIVPVDLNEGVVQVPDPARVQEDHDEYWDDEFESGRLLRCIIAKRFSNETILWYMSKETWTEGPEAHVSQTFSFWAKLMILGGDSTPDKCRYPSQTSILTRNGDPGWQSLANTIPTDPPTVELLD